MGGLMSGLEMVTGEQKQKQKHKTKHIYLGSGAHILPAESRTGSANYQLCSMGLSLHLSELQFPSLDQVWIQ